MNGIRPTVGIEFDDKYTNAKNKLLDFVSKRSIVGISTSNSRS